MLHVLSLETVSQLRPHFGQPRLIRLYVLLVLPFFCCAVHMLWQLLITLPAFTEGEGGGGVLVTVHLSGLVMLN